MFGSDPRRFETTVKEILKDDQGRVCALKTVKLKGRDEVPGSEQEIPCQLMLIAAGFVGCRRYIAEAFGVEVGLRGTVAAQEGTHRTSREGVFVAGDMRRGQSLVVWGIVEGREAAREVDAYLMGYTEL